MAGRNHIYMSTQSQIDANRINATKSTGPSSSEGKSASSKNALISGLFTTHDFVLPDEASLYKDFFDTMFQELCPAGLLENTLANQIAGAAWRLRRCDLADSDIASHTPLDPLLDTLNEKQLRSIERARAASQNTFHRSINQLRKIQTERINRIEIDWAKCTFAQLADTSKTQQALIAQFRLDKEVRDLQDLAEAAQNNQVDQALEAIMNTQPTENTTSQTSRPGLIPTDGPSKSSAIGQLASFCKTAEPQSIPIPKVGRNSPCPCRSGKKFKQCCIGKAA